MGCSDSKSTNTAASQPIEKAGDDNIPTIYFNVLSPVSRAVVLVAHELGVKINVKDIDLSKGEQNSDWFLKINQNHSVPVMTHGDTTICESIDIAKYLVENFCKEGTMYPSDKREQIDEILNFTNGKMYPTGIPIMLAALAGNQADQEVIDSAKSQFEHINGILEADYLTGDCLTIVDMFAFSMVANIMLDPKFVKPDGIDNLNAWVHRIRAKPYFAETHKSFFAVKQSIAASSAAAEQ